MDADKLFSELAEAWEIMQRAKDKRKLLFIKGVVKYIKAMCPEDIRNEQR